MDNRNQLHSQKSLYAFIHCYLTDTANCIVGRPGFSSSAFTFNLVQLPILTIDCWQHQAYI